MWPVVLFCTCKFTHGKKSKFKISLSKKAKVYVICLNMQILKLKTQFSFVMW